MQQNQALDLALSFQKKAQFIMEWTKDNPNQQLIPVIQAPLLRDGDPRVVSPSMIKAISFDLAYLLLRHLPWLHAPIVSELAIDFLNSEFLLPRALCSEVVENGLDTLHSWISAESDWTISDYDSEFLEHLFICSIIAKNESELATDIGFGRNMIELLSTALELEEQEKSQDVFQFAPDLVAQFHKIIGRIFKEHEKTPWILDLYHIKNTLQRDGSIRKGLLTKSFLERLMQLLLLCSPHGASREQLTVACGEDEASHCITLLLKTKLIYEEGDKNSHGTRYQLSRLGQEISSQRFALVTLQREGTIPPLHTLPASFQAALLQNAWQSAPEATVEMLRDQASALSPAALRLVIAVWSKEKREETLLELFQNLLHNRPHAWIRAEICHALPLQRLEEPSQILLECLSQKDPSPMVRNAAKLGLRRLQQPTRSHDLTP